MKPGPRLANLVLALGPRARGPLARVIQVRYGVGPRRARVMAAGALVGLRALQATRRARRRLLAPVRRLAAPVRILAAPVRAVRRFARRG